MANTEGIQQLNDTADTEELTLLLENSLELIP